MDVCRHALQTALHCMKCLDEIHGDSDFRSFKCSLFQSAAFIDFITSVVKEVTSFVKGGYFNLITFFLQNPVA